MKYRFIISVSCWKFEFDEPFLAIRFFKQAMKHYVNRDGKYPVEDTIDLEVEEVEEAEEKPEEKTEEEE